MKFFSSLQTNHKNIKKEQSAINIDQSKCSYFITYDNSFDYANIMEQLNVFMYTNNNIIENIRRVHIKNPHMFTDFRGSSFAIVFDVCITKDNIIARWFQGIEDIPNPVVICPKYKPHLKRELGIQLSQ